MIKSFSHHPSFQDRGTEGHGGGPQLDVVEPGLWLSSPSVHPRAVLRLPESQLHDRFINRSVKSTMCIVCIPSGRHQSQ